MGGILHYNAITFSCGLYVPTRPGGKATGRTAPNYAIMTTPLIMCVYTGTKGYGSVTRTCMSQGGRIGTRGCGRRERTCTAAPWRALRTAHTALQVAVTWETKVGVMSFTGLVTVQRDGLRHVESEWMSLWYLLKLARKHNETATCTYSLSKITTFQNILFGVMSSKRPSVVHVGSDWLCRNVFSQSGKGTPPRPPDKCGWLKGHAGF
jgi:hypothetical protein